MLNGGSMGDKVLIQSRLNRLFHWLFALSVLLLLASGFYIYKPVNLGDVFDMDANIYIQTTVGFFASGVFLLWVYYHVNTEAFRDIAFRRKDIAELKGLLKYYLFLEKSPPVHAKYNAGQRLVYTSWFFAFIFMIVTGLILYSVNFGNILPFPVIISKVRLYHFIAALWWVVTVPVHIYLVLSEDPAKLQAMFTGWLRKP